MRGTTKPCVRDTDACGESFRDVGTGVLSAHDPLDAGDASSRHHAPRSWSLRRANSDRVPAHSGGPSNPRIHHDRGTNRSRAIDA